MTDNKGPDEYPELDLDLNYIDSVYSELMLMEVPLDDDPLQFGIKRIQEKISEVRDALARTERVFLQVSHDLALHKRRHRAESAGFEIAMNHLFQTDIEVRSARTIQEREAQARTKLATEVAVISKLDAAITEMTDLLVVIKAKRSDLKDTSGRLRDQMRLCKDEVEVLGRNWGSKRPNAPPLQSGVAEGGSEDLDTILGGIERGTDALRNVNSNTHNVFTSQKKAATLTLEEMMGSEEEYLTPPKPEKGSAPKQTIPPVEKNESALTPTADSEDVSAFLDSEDDDDEADILGVAEEVFDDLDLDDILGL